MQSIKFPQYSSHGKGSFSLHDISKCGENVIIEDNVKIFHPENVEIGANVYIGHDTILKGYHKNKLIINSNSWIGQGCFFHSAGGIHIGSGVGIGPYVKILSSQHSARPIDVPIICSDILFEEVRIEDECDIGMGTILLPGVTIGKGSIIGAGSVVTKDVPEYSVYVGNPARYLKDRKLEEENR